MWQSWSVKWRGQESRSKGPSSRQRKRGSQCKTQSKSTNLGSKKKKQKWSVVTMLACICVYSYKVCGYLSPKFQIKLQKSMATLKLRLSSIEQQLAGAKQDLEAEQSRSSELQKHLSSQTKTCAMRASSRQALEQELESAQSQLNESQQQQARQAQQLCSSSKEAETLLQAKDQVTLGGCSSRLVHHI